MPARMLVGCVTVKLREAHVCVWLCLCFGKQVGGVGGMVSLWCRKAVVAGVDGIVERSS